MIEESEKRYILEEILKSKSFINSKLNSKLLSYLVECEIQNSTPNEYTIACDVFDKDSSFNPNEDTLVRVSVYNLRKKLERYYQNMGKRKKVRVKIPKGHYEVVFFNYSRENYFHILKNPITGLSIIIAFLLIIIIYLLSRNYSNFEGRNESGDLSLLNNIYSELINSDKTKIISLGDDFIYFSDFSEFNTTSIRKMYRNSMINSEGEFEKFKSEDKNRENLKKLPFSFFNQAAIWPLPHLVKLLDQFNLEFQVKSTSSLNSNDIKSNDILFLGSFWTLGILKQVIKDLGINYNIVGKEELSYNMMNINGKVDSSSTFVRTGVPAFDHIDYCTFIKVPGPNNNTIYLIISFYATGSVGAVKYLSDSISLQELNDIFHQKFGDIPDYFLLIFKSTGYNREVLSTELVKINKIEPKQLTW